MDKEKY